MPPVFFEVVRRSFKPSETSDAFWLQWRNPGDVFSVLLILGGDVVSRALAQLTGTSITPVAFSFGWVAYAVAAVVSAVGENKLMPLPDCNCKVINAKSGYVRDNSSWIVGQIVRDYEEWMDKDIKKHLSGILDAAWEKERDQAEKYQKGSGSSVPRPKQAGLCVSIYRAGTAVVGCPGYDLAYYIGFATTVLQLGIAAIPCGIFGDWGILLVTVGGILLSFASGSLSEWREEKWACRRNSYKDVILTRGNGSQHAIVVLGTGKGLDLEDLAAGQTNVDVSASRYTRVVVTLLAALWIILLITAAGLKKNTWFLLAVGGIGMLQNIYVAGKQRSPQAFGVPLKFVKVIGMPKVMHTLFAVEEQYPHIGASMRATFFPYELRHEELEKWGELKRATLLKAEDVGLDRESGSHGGGTAQIIHRTSKDGHGPSTSMTAV
ncbi:hypothetical protein EDD37DRAFT_70612 [Exophiala viscosa]|uniref:uncharacterized protein n=1 Tax=Exophiala viscosa TaxID=2486360 RepID=UPI00219ADAB1|nr:hypothetical protein EDD37DRAFT_70612 [Exophiala viscosa]